MATNRTQAVQDIELEVPVPELSRKPLSSKRSFNRPRATPIGLDVSHWEVMLYTVDLVAGSLNVVVGAFVSPEARANGAQPLITESFHWSREEIEFDEQTNMLALAYGKVEQHWNYKDALAHNDKVRAENENRS